MKKKQVKLLQKTLLGMEKETISLLEKASEKKLVSVIFSSIQELINEIKNEENEY